MLRLGFLFAWLALVCGCADSTQTIDTRYGVSTRAKSSLNGTSLLISKLRQQGHSVKIKRRISPGIDNYDTIIWMPDTTNAPQPEAIEALSVWLESGFYGPRTLIYVNGGYDAHFDYLEQVAEGTSGAIREEVLRRIAEEKSAQNDDEIYDYFEEPRDDCRWYSTKELGPHKSNQLTGPLLDSRETSRSPAVPLPELGYSSVIEPKTDFISSDYYETTRWTPSSLLEVDGQPMVSKLSSNQGDDQGQIILVSNASFLVNYGLCDPQKEALCDRLLNELPGISEILVLESGPEDIPVSDTEYENRNSWAWVSEAPFRYIVPHFLLFGVMFCFVYFPIFGRPRRTKKRSTTSFRNHVNAVAKQLERSQAINAALNTIRQYQATVDDKNKPRH